MTGGVDRPGSGRSAAAPGGFDGNLALLAEFDLAGQPFEASFLKLSQEAWLKAAWINRGGSFGFQDLVKPFGLTLPELFDDWRLPLEKIELGYAMQSRALSLSLLFNRSKSLELSSGHDPDGKRNYAFLMNFGLTFKFNELPVVGRMVKSEDSLKFNQFGLNYRLGKPELALDAALVVGDKTIPLRLGQLPEPARPGGREKTSSLKRQASIPGRVEYIPPPSPRGLDSPGQAEGASSQEAGPEIKWVELNKSLGPLFFQRMGFALELARGRIKVYVNAGFTLSVLSLDFYGLCLIIPLPGKGSMDFSLSGLAVSLDKPPLSIAGGLYKAPGQTLYNGLIAVRFKDFNLTALGSYGELAGGEASFFLFLMLGFPLGGPPCFFVTGLAAGFGLNRRLKLPELKKVPEFPFVAAAVGQAGGPGGGVPAKGKDLTPATSPTKALDTLSDWVQPSSGDYFISVGVAFTSFNLVRCFALLTVEFGRHLQISLLGQAEFSLPPNLKPDQKPIVFARLAIRVVYNDDEGYISAMIALTSESYLLDPGCHLTGGAAFCAWFKGAYAGDFVVTLGGCRHPLFKNTHYPELDPVGLNWAITPDLKLKAEAYFALTPSCLMAGADLSIVYDTGHLRAWFIAKAAFFLQWKPLLYDIEVAVSIGVSYTFKIFGLSSTLKLELGAAVHIFGPPFSGRVTISLWIISFTISFGRDKPQPAPLTWAEFDQSFLPRKDQTATGLKALEDQKRRLCEISLADGLIREVKDERLIVNALRLRLITDSALPLTSVAFQPEKEDSADATYTGGLWVPPMGLTSFAARQTVWLRDAQGRAQPRGLFEIKIRRENISSAIWNKTRPGLNDGLISQVPKGLEISLKRRPVKGVLPEKGGGYDLKTLSEHEVSLEESFLFDHGGPLPNRAGPGDVFAAMKKPSNGLGVNSRGDEMLAALAGLFGTRPDRATANLARAPEDHFWARPRLAGLGSAA